jgi:hypothetical protein
MRGRFKQCDIYHKMFDLGSHLAFHLNLGTAGAVYAGENFEGETLHTPGPGDLVGMSVVNLAPLSLARNALGITQIDICVTPDTFATPALNSSAPTKRRSCHALNIQGVNAQSCYLRFHFRRMCRCHRHQCVAGTSDEGPEPAGRRGRRLLHAHIHDCAVVTTACPLPGQHAQKRSPGRDTGVGSYAVGQPRRSTR